MDGVLLSMAAVEASSHGELQAGVVGEYRDGTCLLFIGVCALGRFEYWALRPATSFSLPSEKKMKQMRPTGLAVSKSTPHFI
jgi:hypothetical protein